ncbi:hypothetical protein EMCRGX_G026361 [Ephydatia muelleri]|eukprot:Em0014g566a
MSGVDSDNSSGSEGDQPIPTKKAKYEEKPKAQAEDSNGEENSDAEDEEAHSSDVPEDANEEGENESVIYGLEVELKNNKGKYSVLEKDEGRELKLLVPIDAKQAAMDAIEEKHKKNTIPVLEAQEVTIELEGSDQMVVRAKALVVTETLQADKGKQGTDSGECVVKIEKQTGYFVTTSLQDEDDEEPDDEC